jgi:hypothetical protein
MALDAAYVAVGLGVVGLHKAQVAGRELSKNLSQRKVTSGAAGSAEEVKDQFAKAFRQLDKALDVVVTRADTAFEPMAEKLPPKAQEFFKQAREGRDSLRRLVSDRFSR